MIEESVTASKLSFFFLSFPSSLRCHLLIFTSAQAPVSEQNNGARATRPVIYYYISIPATPTSSLHLCLGVRDRNRDQILLEATVSGVS